MEPFSEGSGRVEVSGKTGFIDGTGKFVIEPLFDGGFSFQEGLAAIHDARNWGFIDRSGEVVISPQFYHVSLFHEQRSYVQLHQCSKPFSQWGYINKTGKYVYGPTEYEDGQLFIQFCEGLCPVKIGKRWGYIDKQGRIVIAPQVIKCSRFSEGLASVKVQEARQTKRGFIDRQGNMVIPPMFNLRGDFFGPNFECGLAKVFVGRSMGYIDKTGNFVWGPVSLD